MVSTRADLEEVLLDQQAAASGLALKPENVTVDGGLGAADEESRP